MGVLTEVARQVLRTEGKSHLNLTLRCHDLSLIPYKLIVGHGNDWTECLVELEGRLPLDHGEDKPPPPDPGDPIQLPGILHQHLFQLEQLQPQWLVNGLQHLIPPQNDREGAPAAGMENPSLVHKVHIFTPGPGIHSGIRDKGCLADPKACHARQKPEN